MGAWREVCLATALLRGCGVPPLVTSPPEFAFARLLAGLMLT